ncbi:hypothetical protein NKH77_09330 [Streptomyces sp. M19]
MERALTGQDIVRHVVTDERKAALAMRTQPSSGDDALAALSPAESARLMAAMRDAALARGELPPRPPGDRPVLEPDAPARPRPGPRRAAPAAGAGRAGAAAQGVTARRRAADAPARAAGVRGRRGPSRDRHRRRGPGAVAGRPPWVRRHADGIALTEGANWSEEIVGTSGVGTALAVRAPVRVHSFEHFVHAYHHWSCAAAPMHDPATGGCSASSTSAAPRPRPTRPYCPWSPPRRAGPRANCASPTTASWTGCGPSPPRCSPGCRGRRPWWTGTAGSPPSRAWPPRTAGCRCRALAGRAGLAALAGHLHRRTGTRRAAAAPRGPGGRRAAGRGRPRARPARRAPP